MSRSSRHRAKNGHGSGLIEDLLNDDETSARTRPLSFDEVMLRRKNRKETAGGDVAPEEAHVFSKGNDVEVVSKPLERKVDRHIDSNPSGMPKAREETQRVKTRKIEHASGKEDELMRKPVDHHKKTETARVVLRSKIVCHGNTLERKNDRRTHTDREKDENSRDDLKAKRDKRHYENVVKKHRSGERIRGKYEEHKSLQQAGEDYGQLQNRRENDDLLRKDVEHISQNRDSKDMIAADKYVDKSRVKSEKESRRKHHSNEERSREAQRSLKQDTGKRKHADSPERKERDSTRIHHEESKSKRRRPRSREPDKDVVGRSSSQNIHRGTSHYIEENKKSAAYSSKDMPGGLHFETDNRTSTNGTSSHYRRHSVSSTGLGGYSPRKRKSDSVARTPSPVRRSPEKRTIGWDLNPTENGSSGTGCLVPSHGESSGKKDLPSVVSAALPTATPPIGISNNTRPLNVDAVVDSIQLTQATRPLRRLYVENLPVSVSEKDVMEWINSSLLLSGVNHIQGTQPCISCVMHKEKGQALLEFLTPEVATTAISLDGRSFSGSILKLRRPKDFTHVFTGDMEKSVESGHSISDTVVDSPNKIFVGGISKIISSEMLKEIAQVFGTLKAYHYAANVDSKESYAFLEYVEHAVTLKACAALNGMKLGGQILTVVQAILDDSEVANAEPFYGIPEHAKPLLQQPTEVLKIKNVLNLEDLVSLSEAEVNEVLEDTRIECSRFGTIKSINYVKQNNSNTSLASNPMDSASSAEIHSVKESESDPDKLEKADKSEPQCCEKDLVVDKKISEFGNSDAEPTNPDLSPNLCSEPEANVNCVVSDSHTVDRLTAEMNDRTHDARNREAAEPSYSEDCGEIVEYPTVEDFEIRKMSSVEDTNTEEQREKLEKEFDGLDKDKDDEMLSGLEGVFEPGCVLVEFKRQEASCEAAHCLHGRLFENRVVAVEFVDLDVYRRRFFN